MAKEKDEVTQEVTNQPPATARPGFSTQVTDAPDHPAAANPSQRVQEEQAAGRAAVRDVSGTPAAAGGTIAANPADADPARAAEVAIAMNAAHAEEDLEPPAKKILEEGGGVNPGDVPSRGFPYEPLPGEEATQGTADRRTADPRLTDPDTELGRQAEGRKEARETEELRVKDAKEAKEAERSQRDDNESQKGHGQQSGKSKK